ncbi:Hypothetical protein I595_490 [Croceitalea dokdonensis DOKDO 023]|uniref:DUF4249 domain-containing protein n=1 Tax=Croceitalea dokdonensis DOKDO 023 TaxID=1300341 RepID=A0A0P7ANP7_9FLAO|nr:DUF4249 domain-containing protein [Croceitalea dokdonensis]KPM33587.1 Hypothetical protein I595_490 [Croceitalea dokdonensis DOKDO 023]
MFCWFGLLGCVEPFELGQEVLQTGDINAILVVEASLTNEQKQHEVLLGRGRSFANDTVQPAERNANVRILDGNGNNLVFVEAEPGRYIATEPFAVLPNTTYQLQIQTQDGTFYQSETVTPPTSGGIADLYAQRVENAQGVEGIAIYVDAEILPNQPPFLRYTYEETYKIIAPLWQPFDIVITNTDPFLPTFDLAPREQEERVCYNTVASDRIIKPTNLTISGALLKRNLIRFIPRDDFIISHRYSILVTQLGQTPDAHAFYRALNEQAGNESIFTEVQPGFISGNITNPEDPDEKVLGYFEVAHSSTERLFFNYQDFFPNEPLPPYILNCNFFGAPETINEGGGSPLRDAVESGLFVYAGNNNGQVAPPAGPYLTGRRACGDCTVLGSNMVPDFWTE